MCRVNGDLFNESILNANRNPLLSSLLLTVAYFLRKENTYLRRQVIICFISVQIRFFTIMIEQLKLIKIIGAMLSRDDHTKVAFNREIWKTNLKLFNPETERMCTL